MIFESYLPLSYQYQVVSMHLIIINLVGENMLGLNFPFLTISTVDHLSCSVICILFPIHELGHFSADVYSPFISCLKKIFLE